ncbi:hypothetical protein GCM10011506_26950 [Marivirga lumbricoides]|uniref:Uncharacterized protein n=1 Tax=Marivirga lumbricoides TaxID=1046115 RepID=A0ABQ1MN46_9BACT|nr:hypothetical protein GCM10011506_26950 [Marivirga lumbricoides]
MKNIKFLRTIYWILWVAVLIVFYYSLRYAGDQAMEFTVLALIFWALAFGLNRYIKKLEANGEE